MALAVVRTVSDCLSATDTNILAALRLVSPPPAVHAGVWSVVALAACAAMEAGRRNLWRQVAIEGVPRGDALATRAAATATDDFWAILALASRSPLPVAWRRLVGTAHPFLYWDALHSRWRVRRPLL